MARNLFDRGYAALFLPLDHEQYAAPIYLVLTKFLAETLGFSELPLRLLAFLGGLLAVYGITRATGYLRLGYWGLLPLALLFVNTTVLRYVGEVKPYGLDLGISAWLVALHLRPRPPGLGTWALVGILCPWLSLPSVFVLAAVGLDGLRRRRAWLAPIAAWLISFSLLYFLVLRTSVGSGYLNAFHSAYFFPLPDSWGALRQISTLGLSLLRLTFGFTVVGLIWGALLLIYGLLRMKREYCWLLLPLLLVVAASALRQYSLIERLMLFVLPPLWLVVGMAGREIYHRLPVPGKWVLLGLSAVALGGTNMYPNYYRPPSFSDGRQLTELVREGEPTYLHPEAIPVVDYYTRIHPRPAAITGDLRMGMPPESVSGAFTVLFDVTTQPRIAEAAEKVSRRAAARGCKVKREVLFRAEGLRIKCPVPNSDR